MWKDAIEDVVLKTIHNINRFNGLFPHTSDQDEYQLNDNDNWTNGFWSGLLWLCAEYSGDEFIHRTAWATEEQMRERLEKGQAIDHHDIGFLYSLSSKARWIVEQDEEAKRTALLAADVLMRRWRANSQLIQAWGPARDPENGGRIIIDSLMNLPLLYWASVQTGDSRYSDAALAQAEKIRRYLVRGDDSSYHTFYFNQSDGEPLRGATQQGWKDGSTWSRGQAWGIYGFALSYRYTRLGPHLETSRRMARFFIEHLPEDHVVYWDFDVPINADTERDSSASAIAASGMLELISHLDEQDPDYEYFSFAIERTMKSLITNYATIGDRHAQGLLKHGAYSVIEGKSPNAFTIWGDYFYMEALMKLQVHHKGYWYD